MTVMPLFSKLPRPRAYVCPRCFRNRHALPRGERRKWAGAHPDAAVRASEWKQQAARIRTGGQPSMLTVLEERGFVKDVAGGRQPLDWLLTERRIGAYVGVDPTAPSLHVGHLLPLMVLYWMYLHGFYAVTLLGDGTVQIGDPSGRTAARSRQGMDVQAMNAELMQKQLMKLWTNVKCLGIKHKFTEQISRKKTLLNNRSWLGKLNAVELMRDLGSGMRLGSMLARDSVKTRMEIGNGMAISEFCYPLFQAYDWWSMYSEHGVQLQLGGSDQYGNICAGMDAVNHMRKIHRTSSDEEVEQDISTATFGITTPLLTTASGEKFGKSAGNAVWLDQQMLNSFDLYQYFLRTADDDVERYLKLFTFLSMEHIQQLMALQRQDESKRAAQHVLAKEIVELAHGAAEAQKAERAHKDAFSHGTNTFSLGVLRNTLSQFTSKGPSIEDKSAAKNSREEQLLAYKQTYAASASGATPSTAPTTNEAHRTDASKVVTLPLPLLQPGSFPHVLYAAGLTPTKSEARRLIAKRGAYVVLPISGSSKDPYALQWEPIPAAVTTADPNRYLVDWEALILRSGKSKIQVCRVVDEEQFESEGLTCPGWDEFKKKRAEAAGNTKQ